jgi:hypothetical protein
LPAASNDNAGAVLKALRAGPAPPTAGEVAPYIRRLVEAGEYERAANDWAALSPASPPAHEWPHDGAFAVGSDDTPFTWSVAQGAGASVDVETARNRGGRALRVEYDGFSLPQLPRQLLALPPGRYRLEWRQWLETGEVPRLTWSVRCANDGRLLGQASGQDLNGKWSTASMTFETPAGCAGQWLGLTPIPGERRETIIVWYQDPRILPSPG